MNLTIGLLTHDTGWERMLTQIGAPWTVIPRVHDADPAAYSVIIVNAEPDDGASAALRDYMHAGGALLGDYGRLHTVFAVPALRKRIDWLAPQAFAPFQPSSIVDICGPGRMLTGLNIFPAASAVQLFTAGAGFAASIPFDCSALLRSTAFRRKNFYARTEKLPSEYVSTVSKGQIREVAAQVIEYLHHARGLPFVHTWYYPDGQPTIFTFRVDTDQGSRTELSELYDVCRRHGVRGTWFADVKSHEGWLDHFGTFEEQEIGLHCYEHRTDSSLEAVRANFSKGCRLLREAGFAVSGATAPCGTWNESVDAIYRELDIRYSSEFSLSYDDLPFFPVIGRASKGRGEEHVSSVMQLPVHPICVGSMRRSSFTPDEMSEYFCMWIGNRLAWREPICLYHHPTHHHWEVFDEVFSSLAALKIPSMTYGQYAAWWTKRTAHRSPVSFEDGRIHIPDSGGLHYRISFPGREEVITRIDGTFDTGGTQRTASPAPAEEPQDIARTRKFDPRHPVLNMLDRWYKL